MGGEVRGECHKAGRGSCLPEKEPGNQVSKSRSGSGPVTVTRISQVPSKHPAPPSDEAGPRSKQKAKSAGWDAD